MIKTNEQGIGVFAMILIVAIIGIGGVAAVQVYNQQKASVEVDEAAMAEETQETIAEARAEASTALTSVRAKLQTGLATDVQVAIDTLVDVRNNLKRIAANANVEVKAEIAEIDAMLAKTEASVRSEAADSLEVVAGAIADIRADIEAAVESESEVNSTVADTSEETEVDHSDDGMSGEASMSGQNSSDSESTEVNADAEGNTSVRTGPDEVEIESETSVEGGAQVF